MQISRRAPFEEIENRGHSVAEEQCESFSQKEVRVYLKSCTFIVLPSFHAPFIIVLHILTLLPQAPSRRGHFEKEGGKQEHFATEDSQNQVRIFFYVVLHSIMLYYCATSDTSKREYY